jgi:hypothetical protein
MSIKNELTIVHERLDKKIIVIDALDNRILKMEKQIEYERGFIDATKKRGDISGPPLTTNKQN